ncbi:hypothetical protein [Nocardia sp. NPDC050793]|uniref:hypothetical protein n=1 Tax=Nocardia sp. NPDC050793 TaxID=3155159 RepID=UPI0033E6751D
MSSFDDALRRARQAKADAEQDATRMAESVRKFADLMRQHRVPTNTKIHKPVDRNGERRWEPDGECWLLLDGEAATPSGDYIQVVLIVDEGVYVRSHGCKSHLTDEILADVALRYLGED